MLRNVLSLTLWLLEIRYTFLCFIHWNRDVQQYLYPLGQQCTIFSIICMSSCNAWTKAFDFWPVSAAAEAKETPAENWGFTTGPKPPSDMMAISLSYQAARTMAELKII